jgi:hypothetical protein
MTSLLDGDRAAKWEDSKADILRMSPPPNIVSGGSGKGGNNGGGN